MEWGIKVKSRTSKQAKEESRLGKSIIDNAYLIDNTKLAKQLEFQCLIPS